MKLRRDTVLAFIIASSLFTTVSVLELITLNYRSDICTLITSVRSLGEKGLLTLHFSPLTIVFYPLCYLCPYTAFALSILQGISLGLAATIVYEIAKRIIGDWAKLVFVIFLLAPPIYGPATFGVHVESFMLPFLALMYYYGIVKDDPIKTYIFALLALGFKETAFFPILGLFLWRIAKGYARKAEVLSIIAAVLILSTYFYLTEKFYHKLGLLHQRYFFLRKYVTPNDVLSLRKIVYLAFLSFVYPLLALSIWSSEFLIALPKILNDMLIISSVYVRFDFGYQYGAIVAIVGIIVTILMAKRVGPSWLKSNLILAIIAFLLLSPITPIANWVIYSNLWGEHTLLPPYPAYPMVTYRPILFIQTQCFWKAFKLYHEALKVVNPKWLTAVNDPIDSIFCCKFNVIHNGEPIYLSWDRFSKRDLKGAWRFTSFWVLNDGKTRTVINEYGLEDSLDLPIFIWKMLGAKVYPVKGIGVIYVLPKGYYKHLKNVTEYVKEHTYYAIMKYKGGIRRLTSFYLPLNFPGTAVAKAKVYFDFNGNYTFYVSPNVISLKIDGKEYKPDFSKRELMRDRMWGALTAKLYLTKGWHTLEVKFRRGFLAIYWKGPYSCAPQPLFGTRFGPLK